MCPENCSAIKGFTLLEVLVTIIVIGVAATALMGVFTSTVATSANPMIQQQAIAIAEAYQEEIQLKSFSDPTQIETGGDEAGESRANYDDVQDYDDPDDRVFWLKQKMIKLLREKLGEDGADKRIWTYSVGFFFSNLIFPKMKKGKMDVS